MNTYVDVILRFGYVLHVVGGTFNIVPAVIKILEILGKFLNLVTDILEILGKILKF